MLEGQEINMRYKNGNVKFVRMTATDPEEHRKLSLLKVEMYLEQKVDIPRGTINTEKQGYIINTKKSCTGRSTNSSH